MQTLAKTWIPQIQWGSAILAFGPATFIIGGCRLILHLREGALSFSNSTHQSSGDQVVVAYPTATASDV